MIRQGLPRCLVVAFQVAVFAAVSAVGAKAASAANDDAARIAKGLRIAPVKLKLTGLDRNLVGLGSYIVNAQGACNDCHTNPSYAPGHDPFKGQPKRVNVNGYLAGGRVFGPGIVSRNITPDSTGKPAGLTAAQFLTVLRTGKDPGRPGRLLQVMPWPIYQDMTDSDIRAIYEYLRAIPSR
jgi:hypothetical protein